MNKFQFITHLMDTKKFTPSQKERFLKLASKEFGLVKPSNEELWEEIQKIKQKLGDNEDKEETTAMLFEGPDGNHEEIHVPSDNLWDVKELIGEEAYIEMMKAVDVEDLKSKKNKIESNIPKRERKQSLRALLEAGKKPIGQSIESKDNESVEKVEGSTSDNSELTVEIKSRTLHKPSETKKFLSLFNNSPSLKFLTHRFNDGKRDYDEFIASCRREFNIAREEYKNVPSALIRRIEEFAFSEKAEWFIRKGNQEFILYKGWSEKSFIDWYKKGINVHPGYDAKWNKEMIIPFKETIEVRAGNLPIIIEEAINLSLGNSKSNFSIFPTVLQESSLKEAEFYTDVDKLQKALFLIFSVIKEVADKNLCFELSILYENETLEGGKFKKLIITHVESEPTKNSNDPAFAKGDLKSIQTNLWGLCNYEITGKFPDGCRKRIFLTDNVGEYKDFVEPKKSQIIESENIKGFSHILKFY